MRLLIAACALAALLLMASACSTPQTSESLPPTAAPAPSPTPSPTPEGGGVESGFFVLNLSKSDQEGLEKRTEEIYQQLIGASGDVDRGALIDAYQELADYTPGGGEGRAGGPGPRGGADSGQGRGGGG